MRSAFLMMRRAAWLDAAYDEAIKAAAKPQAPRPVRGIIECPHCGRPMNSMGANLHIRRCDGTRW